MQIVDLTFEHFGQQHQGVPLLILHGFFASSRNWRSLARQLAVNRQVYVLDMRNHGASPHHPQMDYPAMAADIAAFLDKQHIPQADFLGHSMGGKIAMWLALTQPQYVHRLIIADIAPVSYQHSFDNTVNALKNLPLHELGNRKQAEEWLATHIADLTYRQFLLQNLIFENASYRWRVNLDYFKENAPYIVGFPVTDACYQQSVLFLGGDDSAYLQEAAIYKHFPLAVIQRIKGAGHWLHVDAPEEFSQKVQTGLL